MAVEHAGADAENLVQGVNLVLKGLSSVLKRHGVECIDAEGADFDPSEHEAVSVVEAEPATEAEPAAEGDRVGGDSVVRVVRAGYRFKDRLLRPARVVVARAPAARSAPAAENAPPAGAGELAGGLGDSDVGEQQPDKGQKAEKS
jgi:molecular chaperone GrpE